MRNLKTLLVTVLILITANVISQVRYYASNRVLNAVNTYQEDGTYIEEFIEKDAGGLSNPQDIVLHPEGFLLVTGTNNPQIKKFDLETGAFLGDWSDSSFDLTRPSKMAIGPDDKLYVTQWGTTAETSKIVHFDLAGNYLGAFTPSAPQGLGLVWDEDGNLYISLFGITIGSGTVKKYDTNGNFLETFIDTTVLQSPASLWWDTNGDLLVQDYTEGKVLRYSSTGDYIDDFITGLINPEGHTYLPNGNLLISDRGDNKIIEYEANGNLVGRWDNGGTLAGPNFIKAIDITMGLSENTRNAIFVTPTIGNRFNINPEISHHFSTIEVLSISGRLVDSIQPRDTAVWNASNLNEGLYILNAINSKGAKTVQKIIIKH